jgi:hypothetical protein
MRPQAVVTATDADTTCYQENSKEGPGPPAESVYKAVPGNDGYCGKEGSAQYQRYRPVNLGLFSFKIIYHQKLLNIIV